MYGAVITEPVTGDGDIGVFFLHNEGYSTMCGHAIIAVTRMVIETGIVKAAGSQAELNIDAPPGRIVARAWLNGGRVERVEFRNLPSFVLYSRETVKLETGMNFNFDLAYGGAFYVIVDDPGLSLHTGKAGELIDLGRKIKQIVTAQFDIKHPFEEDLGFLYGTIFTGEAREPVNHSRNVCIFADGELDRSPTGTGISARAAIHYGRGELEPGKWITIESILGTTMDVRIADLTRFGPYDAVIPEIAGTSHFTGRSEFWFDPDDPLKEGFIIR
jgi:trans-L-3-hydroxyproline dehydratase